MVNSQALTNLDDAEVVRGIMSGVALMTVPERKRFLAVVKGLHQQDIEKTAPRGNDTESGKTSCKS